MKPSRALPSVMAALVLLSPACRKLKTPEAVERRAEWVNSLNDSIALYQRQIQEVDSSLARMRERVGSLIGNFDYVENAREVEGYYIYSGWKGRYPLSVTGLVARVSKDERFELIATLTGKVFNEIGVSSGGESVGSAVVPHDQALNYRAGNLNKVCFSGEKADSIGAFIAAHDASDVTVTYLQGGRTASLQLPADEKRMISATWQLYNAQREMNRLEKELPRLTGRIAACRKIIDNEK